MSGLTIHYELEGTGWARMVFTLGDDCLVFEDLSYLDEPLHDLLFAGLSAAFRRVPLTIEFDNEGAGLSRLSLEVGDVDEPPSPLALQLSFARRHRDDATGWFDTSDLKTNSEEFARAVLLCADAVRTRYGLEVYGQQWLGEGFPVRALEALRSALSVSDPLRQKCADDSEAMITAPS